MATIQSKLMVDDDEFKLRKMINEMVRKKENPELIKGYLRDVVGYKDEYIDNELNYQLGNIEQRVTSGGMASGDRPIGDVETRNIGQSKAALSLLDELEKTIDDTEHADVFAPVRGTYKKFNPYNVEAQTIQAQINSSKQLIGKYLEGGVLRKEDEVKYEKILPKLGDSVEVAKAKVDNVRNMITMKTKAEIETLGQGGYDVTEIASGLGIDNKEVDNTPLHLETKEDAFKWLQANGTDPRAKQVREKLDSSGFVPPENGLNKANNQKNTDTQPEGESGKGTLTKIGEGIGELLGGDKIGEAIGNIIGSQLSKHGEAGKTFENTIAMIEQRFQEGKITQEERDKLLDGQEASAKSAFGYDGPSFKQVAFDAGKVALTVLGGAELKGATFLGTVGRSALWGGTYGLVDAQADEKGVNLGQTAEQTIWGAAFGAAFPLGGKAISKTFKSLKGVNTKAEALGEILQGKKKDLKPGQRVFSVLKTEGVKTYEDLGQRVDEFVDASARKVDEVLGSEGKIFTPKEMETVGTTTGGKKVRTNYVTQAIEHLQEFFTSAGDKVMAGNYGELLQKAKKEGLSTLEINQLSRKYGIEFGDKAFTKLGEPKTSVSAQLYENVRKGVKAVARKGVNGPVAKRLDSLISDTITVRNLVKKNIESVNKLEQKVIKRGWGDKLGRSLGIAVDVATGGVVSSFFKKLAIPSNMGNKSLNALGIEERLASNLKILSKAASAKTYGAFESAIKKFNRNMVEKVKGGIKNVINGKGKVGLMSEEVSPRVSSALKKQYELAKRYKATDDPIEKAALAKRLEAIDAEIKAAKKEMGFS